ncbi:MAG TPA: nitrogenase [Fibrobacteres bacterium]|nr:nitrogenase [Fibrobacterota bacterium]
MNSPVYKKNKSSATQNTCTLCAPLGASVVFKGVENSMMILHGGQGCATYIRRYIIGTCREPVDIASSSFSETEVIFGGEFSLGKAIDNVIAQYHPEVIGIATTCLAETIGDDINGIIKKYNAKKNTGVHLIPISTPSYKGTHIDGFNAAVYALCDFFAQPGTKENNVGIFPGFLSAADLRHIAEIVRSFKLEPIIVPDYSQTLDGGVWKTYHSIAPGGTGIARLKLLGSVRSAISFVTDQVNDAAGLLHARFGVPAQYLPVPIGVKATDSFVDTLKTISGREPDSVLVQDRARLIDSYIDGHKMVYNKKTILYGDAAFVSAMARFSCEIGLCPVCIATGDRSASLKKLVADIEWPSAQKPHIVEDADFTDILELSRTLNPDLVIGNSKGYQLSCELGVPLIRVGFPIADRIGGERILHTGYKGSQELYDRIVNTIIARSQESSDIGYGTY